MWRWLFVLLLLANSLMFFWYAQLNANKATMISNSLPQAQTIELFDDHEFVRQSNSDSASSSE